MLQGTTADHDHCAVARQEGEPDKKLIVLASLGPDRDGRESAFAVEEGIRLGATVILLEGPRCARWESAQESAEAAGWNWTMDEFLTTEFGELCARRRLCLVATLGHPRENILDAAGQRAVVAAPMSLAVRRAEDVAKEEWTYPASFRFDGAIPRVPLLPVVAGHIWPPEAQQGQLIDNQSSCEQAGRVNVFSLSGPLRWPTRQGQHLGKTQEVVWDRRGPPGAIRFLTPSEVWACQGREADRLADLVATHGER